MRGQKGQVCHCLMDWRMIVGDTDLARCLFHPFRLDKARKTSPSYPAGNDPRSNKRWPLSELPPLLATMRCYWPGVQKGSSRPMARRATVLLHCGTPQTDNVIQPPTGRGSHTVMLCDGRRSMAGSETLPSHARTGDIFRCLRKWLFHGA